MFYILLQAAAPAAAPAQGQPASGGGGMSMILLMGGMFLIMYFLMIRPQQKKQKETQKMLDSLQVNDRVMTTSGIHGRIASIKPDKNIIVVEIDSTNHVRVDFDRSAVAGVVNTAQNTEPATTEK